MSNKAEVQETRLSRRESPTNLSELSEKELVTVVGGRQAQPKRKVIIKPDGTIEVVYY